jgi:hypothetical protein
MRNSQVAAGRGAGGMEAIQAAAASKVAGDQGTLMAGFGSIGGEEMLSYMMISDALSAGGGEDWVAWQAKIGPYLGGIQNADGSWSGHHCITSAPFTTAAAVMTLGAGVDTGSASVTTPANPGSWWANQDGGGAMP